MTETPDQFTTRLNMETARISWQELERHFARGELLTVSSELDLLEVGVKMVQDDSIAIDDWLKGGVLRKATDVDATRWNGGMLELWAVVVAPWILVQEKNSDDI